MKSKIEFQRSIPEKPICPVSRPLPCKAWSPHPQASGLYPSLTNLSLQPLSPSALCLEWASLSHLCNSSSTFPPLNHFICEAPVVRPPAVASLAACFLELPANPAPGGEGSVCLQPVPTSELKNVLSAQKVIAQGVMEWTALSTLPFSPPFSGHNMESKKCM